MGDKSLIQELRDHGEDPGPLSDSNRGYWKRKLQDLKRSPGDGRGVWPRRKGTVGVVGFSSDEEDGGERRYTPTRERMLQRAVRRKKGGKLPGDMMGPTAPALARPGHASLHVVGACLGIAIVSGYVALLKVQEARVETELRRLDSKNTSM